MPDGAKAGEVFLDLSINKKDYNNQLSGIERAAGRIAGRLKAAFAVGSIAAFGKKCLDLGSDLQEAQNVVDVTFTTMSDKVNRFAQEAMTTAGLSETMAKRYVGTFGAMADAFGFSEKEAYRMSTALTTLAGDVASFYNISQDEAYTKLESVFTGETETLKDLGVVMTQAALDQYALANGYGKTTAAMTEQEKVALRYAFVQSQLANAAGDFARTQGSWANQCRILALQAQSAMAAVGQGLINLLTPAIRVINMVMGKVVALANLFRDFTAKIFGDASGEGSGAGGKTIVGQIADDLNSATGAASKLGGAATGAGSGLKSASKSAKELKRTLEGFDQIIKAENNSKSSSSGGGSGGSSGSGSGAGGIGGTGGELAGYNAEMENAQQQTSKLSKLIRRMNAWYSAGLRKGLGNTKKNIRTIQKSLQSVGKTLTEIFISRKVLSSAQQLVDSISYNFGQLTGSISNVATALGANLSAGLADSLEENRALITDKLSNILSLDAELLSITGDFGEALAEVIGDALTSDTATQITSDIYSILETALLSAWELLEKVQLDVFHLIADPFLESKDKIKEAVENTLEPVATVIDGIRETVEDAFQTIGEVYDQHVSPMLRAFADGWSDTFDKALNIYNETIAPMLKKFGDKVSEMYTEHFSPAFDKIGYLVGEVADAVTALYENALKPLVDWAIENLVPVLAAHFEQMGENAVNAIERIVDIIGGLSEALGGVIEFLTGVFTGDWDTAWEGLKKTADGVLTALLGEEYAVEVKAWFAETAESLGAKVDEVMSGIKSFTANLYATVATKASEVKSWWEERTAEWKDKASAFSNKASTAVQTVKDAWSSRANQWKDKAAAFSNKATTALQSVKDAWKSRANTWKDKTAEFGIKIKGTVNDIKQWFNKNVIAKVNNAIHKVPLLKNVSIPYLAQGGYVKRNTPQLAMIGDNRHQGEVVAPEDKLAEMARQAAANAGGYDPRVYELLAEILALLKSLNLVAIDPESLRKYFISKTNQNTKASGGRCELLT